MPLMKFGQQKSFPTTWIERWMKGCGDPRVEEETGGRPMMEKWKNGGNFENFDDQKLLARGYIKYNENMYRKISMNSVKTTQNTSQFVPP